MATTDADRPTGGGNSDAAPGGTKPDGGVPSGGDGGTKSDVTVRPPPDINTQAKRIVPGRARLLGSGLNSCSNQTVPLPAERWCVFELPGKSLGSMELWVVNLTKAVNGTATCDPNNPTNPDCLQLSTTLWTGQPGPDVGGPSYPSAHRFDGDTLIFHADAKSGQTDLYEGPIYAWRAGWPKARRISTDAGVTCSGHGRAAVAWCIDKLTGMDVTSEFDILAGNLPATENTSLPKVARILPLHTNQVSHWRATFSRDGKYFAYSAGGSKATDPEVLRWMLTTDTGNSANHKMVAGGASLSRWQIALDSKHWYYYKGYNYDNTGAPAGTLYSADFPDGGNERMLADKVGAYLLLNNGKDEEKGVGFLQNVDVSKGDLKIFPDLTNLSDVKVVAEKIAGAAISRDLRFTQFAKEFDDMTGTSDAHVAKNDGSKAQCSLTDSVSTDLYGAPFNASSGLTFWADKVDDLGLGEGWLAVPDDCSGKKQFARNVDYWYPINDLGVIYSDDGDGETSTLRFAVTPNGKEWPAGNGTVVQEQMGRTFSLTLPNYDTAVFSLSRGNDANRIGVYVFTAFPFTAASPDAGTSD